ARSPQLELVALVNRDAGPDLARELGGERVRVVVLPVSARSRAQWALGELALVARAAQRARVEVLHSMANFAPAYGRVPRVVTIHDLQYRAVPDQLSLPVRALTGALVSLAARGAQRIVAVSAAGAQEIVAGLGVERARIDVVPNGVRPPGPASSSTALAAELRDRNGLTGHPIALSVATNLPHKNLPSLIDALTAMSLEQRPLLVLAGHGTDDGALLTRARAVGVADHVRLLGSCTTDELDALYEIADCLVLPTLHEGFGLPVLEAMARSLPVACSDIAALREVAGDAALYFDPRRPEQIAARVGELLRDRAAAERLAELGRAQSARFSWAAAAEGTLASYARALARPVDGP
ncbi:MAG TPA: glycosyltransferase family 1 protein, partial [Solirubrobacteraceae bacterium]|nr:glycosyltransferase family 1 protein [Solirubrobacteraceae bacterium]